MSTTIKTALLIILLIWSPFVLGDEHQQLQARALTFPEVGKFEDCPISIGRHDVVPHNAENIFCAACAWHGSGPVYISFAWAKLEQAEAKFVLSDVRNVSEGIYSVKAPIVAEPDYQGPILIRARRLDDTNQDYTLFPGAQSHNMQQLKARPTEPSVWNFWGWGVKLSSPGCYALQIDTIDSSGVVVFEATD